jgi:hypothetical protein
MWPGQERERGESAICGGEELAQASTGGIWQLSNGTPGQATVNGLHAKRGVGDDVVMVAD